MPTPLHESPLYESRPGGFGIQPASQDAATPINAFIHLSQGLSNSYLIVTREGRIVINTGMGFEAPVHRRNYDAVDASPVRYILITQGHVDHVGGIDLFLEDGTEVVAQAGSRAHQDYDARIARFRASRSAFAFGEAIARALRYLKENLGDAKPTQSRAEPTLTFEDHTEFELGGLRVELIATPGGETTDSMVIWLPQHRICFTGNLFGPLFPHVPNLVTIRGDRYREALSYIECVDRVRDLEPEMLLTGHFEPIEGRDLIRSELFKLREGMQHVHDETVRGMNRGRDVYTLMREIRIPDEYKVGEGYGLTSWNVRAIWEHYAGWFHHHSSTELYTVPPSSVHPDLVELAGGPDAVVERARKKLESGAPVEAVHLAEVALAAHPGHAGALQLSIDAHQQLESESTNFWLTSWLRKHVADLRERLGKNS